MAESFTWISFYEEAAQCLLAWRDRQKDLIAFLENLRTQGLKVTPLNDQDEQGARFLLEEIDPFTFFGTFNRGIREDQRLEILRQVREFLGITSPLPSDFDGVPLLNNQRSWFFAYKMKRRPEDIRRLWNIFGIALEANALADSRFEAVFDEALTVNGTNINLTIGLFWIRPRVFVSLDQNNRRLLEVKLPSSGLTGKFYLEIARQVLKRGDPLPELSYRAWQGKNSSPILPSENNYWMVGAYWPDHDPADQTERFIEEGIWQNGYEDKFLEEVRAMRVGDRIAIKAAATQRKNLPFDARGKTISKMTIKATGTVVANRGDGRVVEVEWDPATPPREWYFYTYQRTVWRLKRDNEYANRLIEFVFEGTAQDYSWFCKEWEQYLSGRDLPAEAKELGGAVPYSVADALSEGVFMTEAELEQALDRLASKKNLILQGPPGVGKTFIARKLAYSLMGERDDERIEMVQFHQSYSYEDFIRGYRPLADAPGTFGLQDGIFFEFCSKAAVDPDRSYVFIIDEINRGNLSQIFGELLMLIEADKRGPGYALPLVYRRDNEPRFHVPANVYLIGLMNIADRSLAMVDYALRRRFAFISLSPRFGSPEFRTWLGGRGMEENLIDLIVSRMTELNRQISDSPLLGPNYQVGHSFFCPKGDNFAGLGRAWYDGVVCSEIVPLLEEYWFDDRKRVEQTRDRLLAA